MRMKRSHKKGYAWMLFGSVLIAGAVWLTAYNIWIERRAGQAADGVYVQLLAEEAEAGETEVPMYVRYPDMEMPTVEVDGNLYIGTLEIPALELSLPVMSEWSYPKLKIAPCRYTGSAYQNNMVIAAHNYATHFGQLKNLTPGDSILFTDADGNLFSYQVGELEVLGPTDIEDMVDSGWELTLFTCTYGGKTRLTVRCQLEPKEE